MLPAPFSRPSLHALRCVLVSMVLAAWALDGKGSALSLWTMTLPVGEEGLSLAGEMLPRVGRTMLIMAGAMLLAGTLAMGLTQVIGRVLGRFGLAVTSLLGDALAALPLAGFAWWALGAVVTQLHLPIDSLLPYTPPPNRDSMSLYWGRTLWAWLVPMLVLAVPLTGLWLAAAADAMRWLRRAAPSARFGFDLLSVALRDRWLAIAGVALAGTVGVETAFGVRGWGSFIHEMRRGYEATDAAAAIYVAGLIMALWTVVLMPFTRPSAALDRCREESWQRAQVGNDGLGRALALMGVMIALWALWALSETALFEGALVSRLNGLLPALLHDLRQAGSGAAMAVMIGLAVVAARAVLSAWRWAHVLSPIRAMVWVPLGAMALPLSMTEVPAWWWPACALGLIIGERAATLATDEQKRGAFAAARALGVSAREAWWRHVLPVSLRDLAGSALQSVGWLLLWQWLVHGCLEWVPVGTPRSLGSALNRAQSDTLTQLDALVMPTLLGMVTVLLFWRLARWARPANVY